MKLNINPLLLDDIEFYRVEMLLEAYEKHLDEQQKHHEGEENKYQKEYSQAQQKYKTPDPKSFGNTYYGGFKTPKLNIPKFNVPKL